jgi:hypothetical protein
LCGGCRTHLGWAFRGKLPEFYGLILDRLVEAAGATPGMEAGPSS